MKAILITPATQTIEEIDLAATPEAVAAAIGHAGEAAYLYANGDALYTDRWNRDSEGPMFVDDERALVSMRPGLIIGRGLADAATSIDEARAAIRFRTWYPEPEADRPPPVRPGDRVTVCGTVSTSNSAGGTHILDRTPIEVEVVRAWYDYETGYRFHGRIVDPAVAATVRQKATSEHGPDWYRANRPDDQRGLRRAEEALLNWKPEIVCFSQFDLDRSSVPRRRR